MTSGPPEYSFKILLVGESGVGKSALIVRFTDQLFTEAYTCTIGVDFKLYNTKLDDKNVRLHIWDTAGQERYRSITSSYYRNSDGILLVFDMTNSESLAQVQQWVEHLEEQLSPRTKVYIVGNKCDEPNFDTISQVREFAKRKGLPYKEVSAKSGERVNELFIELASSIKEYYEKNGLRSTASGGIKFGGQRPTSNQYNRAENTASSNSNSNPNSKSSSGLGNGGTQKKEPESENNCCF